MAEHESRILVIDDDPGAIRLLATLLKGCGKVYFTTRGSEARTMAQAINPDLVLLDIVMPDRDGLKVCQEFKQDPLLAEIPILFVTSQTDADMETQALEAGALDFIHKPPHPQIVKARVSNYLALKHHTDQLRMLSTQDGLTGIANRRSFDKAIENEWRRACRNRYPLSLLMLDIDHFKQFNDRYGHQAGDDCLRTVAGYLATRVRRPGDLVARYGGEEFAMLLPKCPLEYALEFAESILADIAELEIDHTEGEETRRVTVSIGVGCSQNVCKGRRACWHEAHRLDQDLLCGMTSANLIRQADMALYQAKQNGRNRIEVSSMPLAFEEHSEGA
nr:diguanylate cyclase [uncultured Desulfobulbus sp.]